MDRHVDVAIIGAGSAGLSAASEVRKKTDNFLIINHGNYGTTCARVGCMPSKVLIHVANDFHRRNRLEEAGIKGGQSLEVDIPKIMNYVRSLRDYYVASVMEGISNSTKHNLEGRARFLEPTVLDVDGQIIRARKIIIATGSRPVIPPSWHHLHQYYFTSDDIFELETLPTSIGVVGLGVIGVELGLALSRLGIDVVGINRSEKVAGISDPIVLQEARKILQHDFAIWSGNKVELEEQGGKIRIFSGSNSKLVDKVLLSMGRRPNLDHLGLDNIGIRFADTGIPLFNRNSMQIEGAPIYLAGDVTLERAILHEASDEGRIAGYNAVHENQQSFKRRTPIGICFSDPQIGFAGAKLSELSELDPIIGEVSFRSQGRSRAMRKNEGLARLYACPKTGRLLGAEMIAPSGEHLVHLLAWAIQMEQDVFSLLQMPFYHPVVEEGLRT
ncbi:MAG: dihydrolipoyl dehydrogenase, partial [SAR324 cluster bacterium]|nr:dihydrolipoyl dehydrogenase [SAR324 cluster bacterium]